MSKYPYIAGVNYESMADGEGMRATIFLSGCPHHCPGCQNYEAQSETFGIEITDSVIDDIASNIIKRPFLEGITLSGGDPLFCPERTMEFMDELLVRLHRQKLTLWVYTGYLFEDVKRMAHHDQSLMRLLEMTDVMVDGRFEKSLADRTLLFRGSSNQRIIDVPQSLRTGTIVLWEGCHANH